jgi:hypothetical protein
MSKPDIQQEENRPNDEIDIFDFFSRIWKAFKNFLESIKNLVVLIIIFLIRKLLWIISFVIVGAIAGYYHYSLSDTYYSSFLEGNVVGFHTENPGKGYVYLDNRVVIDYINKLHNLTAKPALLACYLNISEENARSIRDIRAYYGIDVNKDRRPDYVDFKEEYNPVDTTRIRVPSYIYIQVSVYDETILPQLREGLFKYVENNAYIQELHKITREQKKKFITEIDAEITKIDSLQRSRFRTETKFTGGQVIFAKEAKENLFYQDILYLYSRKQQLERELEIDDNVIVTVQDFTPLEQEANPRIKYISLFAYIMGIMGVIISLIWQCRKQIWALIKEDPGK